MSGPDPAVSSLSLAPWVRLGGADLPEEHRENLVELRVRRALRTIGRCTLVFDDPGLKLLATGSFALGRPLDVRARGNGTSPRTGGLFQGQVTSVAVQGVGSAVAQLHVVAEDAAYRLSRSLRAASHEQPCPAHLSKAIRDAGLTPQLRGIDGAAEYLLHADSDLAVIDDLAARCGCQWAVVDDTFHLWPAGEQRSRALTPVELALGDDLVDFSVRVHDDAARTVVVRGWDVRVDNPAIHAQAQARLPKGISETFKKAVGLRHADKGAVATAWAAPRDLEDARRLARVLADSTGWVTARGRAKLDPGLHPGDPLEITGAGPLSSTYSLIEVEHLHRRDGSWTCFVAGDREPAGIGSMATGSRGGGGGIGGAAGAAPRPWARHTGLVTGTVTGLDDPEKQGRVKVALGLLGDEVSTAWARVAAPGAGEGRGMVILPEVQDEVLVGFENGDTRHPVVLGGLFGPKRACPADLLEAKDGRPQTKALRSRLGHTVTLHDGTDKIAPHVCLTVAGGKVQLRLGKDRVELQAPQNVPVTITSGSASVSLDGKGAVAVKGTAISIKGSESVAIEGGTVTIKATQTLEASGPVVAVKGKSSTTVEASGQTAIKGGMVMIN